MGAKRGYGTGHIHVKHGAYYGRWWTSDGRRLNRRLGPIRAVGSSGGLTRAEAERVFRRAQDREERQPRPEPDRASPRKQAREERQPRPATVAARVTVDQATDDLRRRLAIQGARKSYLEGCHSMQRVHITPRLGDRPIVKVTTRDIEDVGAAMLADGLKPKTVRNLLTFLHQVFEHAIDRGWTRDTPVRKASRPRRKRAGDIEPDLQFLTLTELEAVLRAIPHEIVHRQPAPTRRGRSGPAPPPPPDVLGPVLRVVILTAAMTGLRQSELFGLRWRDVDWSAQRIRVRNTWVRGEHSTEGKSDLSTRRRSEERR